MKKLIIRADGNSEIGLGHIIRCISLATMLRDNFSIQFAISDSTEAVKDLIVSEGFEFMFVDSLESWAKKDNIIILDSYKITTEFTSLVRKKCLGLVCIDDNSRIEYDSDFVINYNAHASHLKFSDRFNTSYYLGTQYALLRNSFFTEIDRPWPMEMKKCVICFGGADSRGLTKKYLNFFESFEQYYEISVLVGSANKNLRELKRLAKASKNKILLHEDVASDRIVELCGESDFALSSAGVLPLEFISQRVPLILGYVAENQRLQAEEIGKRGAGLSLKDLNSVKIDEFSKALELLQKSDKMQIAQAKFLDNKSPSRIRKIFNLFN